MSKALVTGANGFSAGYLIKELLKNDWEVRGTDLQKRCNHEIEYIQADLTQFHSLRRIADGVNVVFHPAALFSYSAPMEKLRAVNVIGTENLIRECFYSNVKKIVCWSSVAAYGSADPCWYKMPITEDQKLNPNNEGRYDISKREQEEIGMRYYNYWPQIPITFIRPAPMYGPGSYYGIYTLFKYVQMGLLSSVPKNLHESSIPLVHVEDVARAAIHLADPNKYNGEIYNVVDNNTLDMVDTLKFFGKLVGTKVREIPFKIDFKPFKPLIKLFGKLALLESKYLRHGKVPRFETDTAVYMFGNYNFSNKKLAGTGFKFKYPDRRLGLVRAVKWYNENGWLEPTK